MDLTRFVKAAIVAGLALSLSTPFSCRPNERAEDTSTCGAPTAAASTEACGADADCSAEPAASPAFACLDPRGRP
jgi:hypothetical protein